MKYKSRVLAFIIFMLTFSVLYIITQDPRNKPLTDKDDSTPERHYRRFGYLQDKFQEALGVRKVYTETNRLLKDERDIQKRLRSDKSSNGFVQRIINDNVSNEETQSESDRLFEQAIKRKFRRYDDNRQVPEVNGRTVMYDESVER